MPEKGRQILLDMKNVITDMIKSLESWEKTAQDEAIALAKEESAFILDANVEQLEEGKRADGSRIGPPYRPLTVRIKREKGQRTDRVTLRDTGDFHESFTLHVRNDLVGVTATDRKTAKLTNKYGREIFGLSDENVQELIERIREGMKMKFKEHVLTVS